jgi:hypothetical protein
MAAVGEEFRGRTLGALALTVAACVIGVAVPSSAAGATTTFQNSSPITIPASGNATPYPSSIVVSGLQPVVSNLTVTLHAFSHQNPIEVGSVLVAPDGRAMLLHFCVGGNTSISPVTFSLSDAGASLPSGLTPLAPGGIYRPTNHDCIASLPNFPPPGPGTNYANPGPHLGGTATLNGTFGGADPNGTWNLFVADFNASSTGSIAGGWSLTLTTPDPAPQPKADGTLTIDANKGKVEKGRKVALTGQLDVAANESCEPNRQIQIQRRKKSQPDSAFATFETVQTDATGNFSLRTKVNKTRFYRAVVSETEACDDETSNTQKVRVQKKKAAQEA